jgi:hypothetical protein
LVYQDGGHVVYHVRETVLHEEVGLFTEAGDVEAQGSKGRICAGISFEKREKFAWSVVFRDYYIFKLLLYRKI